MTRGGREGGEGAGRGEAEEGRSRKLWAKILPSVPKAASTANPDTEGRAKVGGGGTGKDREGKKAQQRRRAAQVGGHGRVGDPQARIPAAQAGFGIPLQARWCPIVREPRGPRGEGGGGGESFLPPFE